MMITFSFYVQGDSTGFDMQEANRQIAEAIDRHKVSYMVGFSASRAREKLWRVSVRFNG